MRVTWAVAAVVLVGVLGGCSSGTDSDSGVGESSQSPDTESGQQQPDGKFTQTWSKDYSRTTCQEWLASMSRNENFVAAADILVGARSVDDADAGIPEDNLIRQFSGDITDACSVAGDQKLNEIGAAVYLTEKVTFKP